MDLQNIMGLLVAAGGSVAAIWAYFKQKNPNAGKLVEQVLKQLQDNNASDAKLIDRVAALTHAETLARYLESKGSTAGTEALQTVVREIFATKA